MKFILWLFIVLLALAPVSFSQDNRPVMDQLAARLNAYSQNNIRTSVYLRASKDKFVCGEDLWFNAFILNAQDYSLSTPDKTLYIQLQQKSSDSIVWQEMYPVTNGIAYGHIYLSQNLPEGDYWLKGYTAHSYFLNQPCFYAFTRIQVVKELKSLRRDNTQQQVAATIKKERVQFNVFPEGGNLVAGLQNQVAFKAVNHNGQPAEVNGVLLKGNIPVVNFKSTHDGMGSFLFTPETNTEYRIKLENIDSVYALPKPEDKGLIMHLQKCEKDSLSFKIAMNHQQEKQLIFLRLQMRGIVQTIAAGSLTDSLEIKISTQNIPQGIAEATIFDAQLRPLAERLLYLHPEQKLNISISPVNEQYGLKQKVFLKIKTTDQGGNPIPTVLSLGVYDRLFSDPGNIRDIVNYYYLSTQLHGNIYDASYYFDSTHADRKEAMDLLLLTQGWRRYTWNEEVLSTAMKDEKMILSDSVQAYLSPVKKSGKEKNGVSLMFFNYNKSISQFTVADSSGRFYLTPGNLAIGTRLFIKYFSEKEYQINVSDPFYSIKSAAFSPQPVFTWKNTATQNNKTADETYYLQYGKTLQEVTVVAKGRGYTDKYLGYLDSIAKYEGNTDYVCQLNPKGYLNCPWCGSGTTKPVEGQDYPVYIGTRKVTSHQVDGWVKPHEISHVIYHYPKYTEEELLKKFKMGVTKGYYQSREFYEPDYDKESTAVSDSRNTLVWKPVIVTDKNGEASVEFFCSDIHSRFIGIIEGVADEGLLGVNKFSFSVR